MNLKRKLYLKEYQREFVKKRRKCFFDDKKCENCDSIIDLELHHTNQKEKESHRIWSWSKIRREEELKKCIILCKKCHKIETAKYATSRRKEHGRGGYNRGCRCEMCYKAQQAHNAQRYN